MSTELILLLLVFWTVGISIWILCLSCGLKEVRIFGENHKHNDMVKHDHNHDHEYARWNHHHDGNYPTWSEFYETLEKRELEAELKRLRALEEKEKK